MKYDGDLTIARFDDPLANASRLRIDRADDRIRIAPELLEQVAAGSHHPDATLTDGVLRIVGTNRTVEYRIGDLVTDAFGATWWQADRIDP